MRKRKLAEIRPFRGVRYNKSVVGDLATAICPPYDIITPQLQQELYEQSDYNFVHLEFGKQFPQDTDKDNRYARSAATLEQWLKQGVLKVEDKPALYLHDQYFIHEGREYRRRGIITVVRVEEWEKGIVRPNEYTLSKPKADRLNLTRALQSNTSTVFAMFEDREQRIASLLATQAGGEPTMSLSTADGERHNIWAITEPQIIGQICGSLADQSLYIADGHHRYETALNYRQEMVAGSAAVTGDEEFNFALITLVDLADPGLVILPYHRMVRGIPESILGGLLGGLKEFFEIQELPLNMPDVWQRADELLAEDENQVKVILFGLGKENLLLLRLRDFNAASKVMPASRSELYKRLNVSIVDHVIVERLLGISQDKKEDLLAYSHDRQDIINGVSGQQYQLGILTSPVKAEVIKAISDGGERMPRKSTYFYPKLPSGLVAHRLI